eukprot:jgi/Orpsp1_1/1190184/evm.model.d7180000077270.1
MNLMLLLRVLLRLILIDIAHVVKVKHKLSSIRLWFFQYSIILELKDLVILLKMLEFYKRYHHVSNPTSDPQVSYGNIRITRSSPIAT